MEKNAAHDGLEAASKLNVNAYDVVVLDRDLPGLRGDTLCQMITERDSKVMVLTLTAAGSAGPPRGPGSCARQGSSSIRCGARPAATGRSLTCRSKSSGSSKRS